MPSSVRMVRSLVIDPQPYLLKSNGGRQQVSRLILWRQWPVSKLITPGERAPDFELKNVDGKQVRLSALQGQPVVLAFLRGFM